MVLKVGRISIDCLSVVAIVFITEFKNMCYSPYTCTNCTHTIELISCVLEL